MFRGIVANDSRMQAAPILGETAECSWLRWMEPLFVRSHPIQRVFPRGNRRNAVTTNKNRHSSSWSVSRRISGSFAFW